MSSSRSLRRKSTFPHASVGALICPAWSESPPPLSIPLPTSHADEVASIHPIAFEVLGRISSAPGFRGILRGVAAAGLVFGGCVLAVASSDASDDSIHNARVAPMVVEYEIAQPVDVVPDEPAPTIPLPDSAVATTQQADTPRDSSRPPAPAQAGSAITSSARAPVDLSNFSIADGGNDRYVGGVTSANGTNTNTVHSSVVDPNSKGGTGSGSLARGVMLAEQQWKCPWPAEAEALGIAQQVVVLQAVVTADGALRSVDLVGDPGHGFGDAALVCARRAKFLAARDADGTTYAATSAPIRVNFTR